MALEYSVRIVRRKDRVPGKTGYSAYANNFHSELHPISGNNIGLAYVPKGNSLPTIRGFRNFLEKLDDIGGEFRPVNQNLNEEEALIYDKADL